MIVDFETVRALLADQLEMDEAFITPQTTFESLDADELDIVELLMALEEEYDTELSAEKAAKRMKTVGQVADYAAEQIK